MFIAPEIGVAFIHNPRAGGQSVRAMLGKIVGAPGHSDRYKVKGLKVSVHSPACRVRHHGRVRKIWAGLYRFGVVRNPWARAVSIWALARRTKNGTLWLTHGLRHTSLTEAEKCEAVSECQSKGFPFWLTEFCPRHDWTPWHDIGHDGHAGIMALPQMGWFTEGGRQIVDDVFDLRDPDAISEAIHRQTGRRLNMRRINTLEHDRYTEYYDSRARDYIGDVFAEDIRRFGYRFA